MGKNWASSPEVVKKERLFCWKQPELNFSEGTSAK